MSQPSACRSSASSLGILSGWAWRAATIAAVLLIVGLAGVVAAVASAAWVAAGAAVLGDLGIGLVLCGCGSSEEQSRSIARDMVGVDQVSMVSRGHHQARFFWFAGIKRPFRASCLLDVRQEFLRTFLGVGPSLIYGGGNRPLSDVEQEQPKMMSLRSSLKHEQRIDACSAGQPANTLPVRYMRL